MNPEATNSSREPVSASAHIAPGGCYHGEIPTPDPANKPAIPPKSGRWAFFTLLIVLLALFGWRFLR